MKLKGSTDSETWDKYHKLREGGDTKLARLEFNAERANIQLHYLGSLYWKQHKILTEKINHCNTEFVKRLKELGFEIEPYCEVVFHPVSTSASPDTIPNINEKYDELVSELKYIADNDYMNPVGLKIRAILQGLDEITLTDKTSKEETKK